MDTKVIECEGGWLRMGVQRSDLLKYVTNLRKL
jgi:hypothetical protein